MKILIINPNSDPEMTRAIQTTAEDYAEGDFEVLCLPTPEAPVFIETYEDQAAAAPGMIRLLKDHEDSFDAFIVACHSDPHLDVLKEITPKPVVGMCEASVKLASMLGHRFSVLSDNPHSVPNKQALIRSYHLQGILASVRPPSPHAEDRPPLDIYTASAGAAIEEDGAEVLILGCAGMTGLARPLMERTGAPVLDGIVCALIVASGLVKAGLGTSKIRRYNPDVCQVNQPHETLRRCIQSPRRDTSSGSKNFQENER